MLFTRFAIENPIRLAAIVQRTHLMRLHFSIRDFFVNRCVKKNHARTHTIYLQSRFVRMCVCIRIEKRRLLDPFQHRTSSMHICIRILILQWREAMRKKQTIIRQVMATTTTTESKKKYSVYRSTRICDTRHAQKPLAIRCWSTNFDE